MSTPEDGFRIHLPELDRIATQHLPAVAEAASHLRTAGSHLTVNWHGATEKPAQHRPAGLIGRRLAGDR